MIEDASVLSITPKNNGGHFHAVRFYDSEPALCRVVASFLREGLMLGQPALVIATREHGQGIVAELRAYEMDVKALQAKNDLVVLNADELMATFMIDGMPSRDKFRDAVEAALDRARRGRTKVTVRTYGEMVDVLWKDGRDVAAIQLEMLWNHLARTHEFSLLCGYAMGSFYKDAAVQEVCRQHTHLVSSDGSIRVSDADSLLLTTLRQ